MPRPTKCRRICAVPKLDEFGPLHLQKEQEPVVLSVYEYEVIRLIDSLEMNQEECAAQMEVARTTVQAIYTSARRKIADALVNGRLLKIVGGNYRVCPNQRECCRRRCPQTCAGNVCGSCCVQQSQEEDLK